jgi:phosphatidylserine decarboxylase
MHSPLTRYGLPQVAVFPLIVFLAMAACFLFIKDARILAPVEIVLFLVFLWMLSFFRDPARTINIDEAVLLSPADGTITDIAIVDDSVLGKGA